MSVRRCCRDAHLVTCASAAATGRRTQCARARRGLLPRRERGADSGSAAELKGKLVGSDRPGTPTDFFTRRVLGKAGVTAEDVSILPLGGSDATVPAFLSGQIQALAVVPPVSFQLDGKGYKQLATIVGERYLGLGFVVLRSRLDELAPQLSDFVA